jgi:hypothetical protein
MAAGQPAARTAEAPDDERDERPSIVASCCRGSTARALARDPRDRTALAPAPIDCERPDTRLDELFFVVIQYLQYAAGHAPLHIAAALLPLPAILIPLARSGNSRLVRQRRSQTTDLGRVSVLGCRQPENVVIESAAKACGPACEMGEGSGLVVAGVLREVAGHACGVEGNETIANAR